MTRRSLNRKKAPLSRLLIDITHQNKDFLAATHHGLMETPSLQQIYPYINLTDLIGFAALSWKLREKKDTGFLHKAKFRALYELFQYISQVNLSDNFKGLPKSTFYQWIKTPLKRGYRGIHDKEKQRLYAILNPNSRKDLKLRLDLIEEETSVQLRGELLNPSKEYITQGQKEWLQSKQQYDPTKQTSMMFIPRFMKRRDSQKWCEEYAEEIVRIISSFPEKLASYQPDLFPFRKNI